MNATAADLLTICQRLIDPGARSITMHRGHGGTAVLRAVTATGEVIVKHHRSPERHRQELHAYQHWTPALGDHVPRLVAASEDPPVLVLTAIPGTPLTEAHLTPVQLADAHRQAGELLRHLHQAAPPRTDPDTTQWLADRGEQWLALATDLLPTARRAEIRDHLKALEQLSPVPAVPCHLDYTPRNLLATPAAEIAVIDFEHSRYDLAARDLVRLATRVWAKHPALEDAFLHGYGPLTNLDRQIITHCSHLDTLTAVVRAAGRAPWSLGPGPGVLTNRVSPEPRC